MKDKFQKSSDGKFLVNKTISAAESQKANQVQEIADKKQRAKQRDQLVRPAYNRRP